MSYQQDDITLFDQFSILIGCDLAKQKEDVRADVFVMQEINDVLIRSIRYVLKHLINVMCMFLLVTHLK